MVHRFLLALLLAFPSLVLASPWQPVTELTAGQGQLVDLAISPSGNTVVVAYSPGILLYEEPAGGWSDATAPTTVLTCTEPRSVWHCL